WDTRLGQKLADIDNAKYDEVAFTSFEGVFQPNGTADYNKGQWDFYQQDVVLFSGSGLKPMTGKYRYHLSSGRPITSSIVLKAGKRYKLTFWCSNSPQVTGATVNSNTL